MGFLIYSFRAVGLWIAVVIIAAAVIMYGITMFGVVSGSPAAQSISNIMYGLTVAWVALVILLALFHSYTKGTMPGRFPVVLRAMLVAVTLVGGIYPAYYAEFVWTSFR